MGVAITDTLSRGTTNISPFPLANEEDMRLSYITTTTTGERDDIDEWRRKAYMLCYVSDLDITYRLGSDITLAGQVWTVEAFGVPDEVLTEDEILNDDGFIKPELISNIFLNDNFVVDSEAAMLALTTLTGNFVIRTDSGQIFVKLNNDDPSNIGDFAEITYPGTVISVNGAVGAVVITIIDLITADTIGFNTAVGATTTITDILSDISDIESDITAIELALADKADLVGGTVPLVQLPYNFNNGIQLIGDDVGLGGIIDAGVTELFLDPASFLYIGNEYAEPNAVFMQMDDSLIFGSKEDTLAYFDFTMTLGLGLINMTGNSSFRINDTSTVPTGIEYVNDYSATYIDRSLIDKGYANLSYWKTAGTSLITAATTVRASGFPLRFESGTLNTVTSSKLEIGILGTNAMGMTSYDGTSTSDVSFIGLVNGIMTLQSSHGSELNRIQFFGNSGNIVAADTRAVPKGIEYFADYSATFTDRSLTDKAYVDSVLVGWPLHGSAVLTDDVSIFGGGNGFDMGNFTPLSYFNINALSSTLDITDVSIFPLVDNTGTYWIGRNSAGSLKSNALHLAAGAITVHGHASYDADYSADYTNRSLVDKEYVTSLVTSGNWKTTGTTTLSTYPVIIEGYSGTSLIFNDNLSPLGQGITLAVQDPSSVIQLVSGDIATQTNFSLISLVGTDGGSGLDITSQNVSGESVTIEFTQSVGDVSAIFIDNRTVKRGFEYNADYSTGFSNRSLADWGNVWKAFGTTDLTANTFIVTNAHSLDLQFTNNQDVTLTTEDYASLNFFQANNSVGLRTGYGAFGSSNGDLSQYFYLLTDFHNGAGVGAASGGMYFLDQRTVKKGIEYVADYSTGYTDRSFVDWGNVWRSHGTTTLSATNTITGPTTGDIIFQSAQRYNFVTTGTGNTRQISISTLGVGTILQQYSPTTPRFEILDLRTGANKKGLEYTADYSANFTSRSIADWGNVWKGFGTTTISNNITISSPALTLLFSLGDGLGAGGRFQINNEESGEVVFMGTPGDAGLGALQYAGDYSANFTNRSLADWGNVWKVKGTTTISGTAVINAGISGVTSVLIYVPDDSFTTGETGVLVDTNVGTYLYSKATGETIKNINLTLSEGFIKVWDSNTSPLGIQYGADYSATYGTRSLTDKGYVLGAKTYTGIQTFGATGWAVRNPANTFSYSLVGSAIAANRIITLPLLTAGDTLVTEAFTQTLNNKTFTNATGLAIRNPADTFSYTFTADAIVANRIITLPLLTAGDTLVTAQFTQTLNNKTFLNTGIALRNPADTFSYTFTASAIAGNRALTFPLITGGDTLVVLGLAQTLVSKTLSTGTIFSAAPTINDGILFTFNPNGTNAGINIGAHTADPGTIANGDLWYQSTTNKYRGRQNAVAVDIQVGLSNTAALDFPSTATNLSADLTITVTGAAVGDVVALGVPNAAVFADSCYTAWVSATDTVTVRFNNYGATTRDPTSQTFKVTVLK